MQPTLRREFSEITGCWLVNRTRGLEVGCGWEKVEHVWFFFSKNCVMIRMNMQVASEGEPACMVEMLLCAGVMLLNFHCQNSWGCFNHFQRSLCVLLCLAHHMSQACLASPKINLFDSLRLWQPFTSTNPAVCCFPSLELQYHCFAGALSNMRNIPCQYRFIQHYHSAPLDRHQLLQSFGRVSISPMPANIRSSRSKKKSLWTTLGVHKTIQPQQHDVHSENAQHAMISCMWPASCMKELPSLKSFIVSTCLD